MAIKFRGKAGSVKQGVSPSAEQQTKEPASSVLFLVSPWLTAVITGQVLLQSDFYWDWATVTSHISENFTFSASEKSIPLPSVISVTTVFGSCDYQFCGAGSWCSFTSMVAPDTCKLKWSRQLSLAAYFHML